MAKRDGTILLDLGTHLYIRFEEIAKAHFTTPEKVLQNYALDYIVSGGFPEKTGINVAEPDNTTKHDIASPEFFKNSPSNYTFYSSGDHTRRICKKNSITGDFFILRPWHAKDRALGWSKHRFCPSIYAEITEEEARRLIRNEIEWLERYLKTTIDEQRVLELIQRLIIGEGKKYTLETEDETIIWYIRHKKYSDALSLISDLREKQYGEAIAESLFFQDEQQITDDEL